MPGAIWKLENLAEKGSRHQGDQLGFDQAKAAVIAAGGGMVQVGPGLEGLTFGAFPANVIFVHTTKDGEYRVSGLRIADLLDPAKRAFFDPSGISSGSERIITLPNYSGLLPLPIDAGVALRFLRSNGPGVQPTWEAIAAGINALLDGANHTDTIAEAVAAGDLIRGNATPKWSRLPAGINGQVLTMVAGLPAWATSSVTNALLDGANHTDTVARAAVRGAIVVGVAGPLWDRLLVGAADTFLGSDGTDPIYRTPAASAAILAPLTQHDLLLHLKPFQVAGSVRINNASFVLTDDTGTNRFANVRVGDRINLATAGTYHPSLFGFRATTSGAADANNITMDRQNTSGADITGATATVFPGDHFDNTLLEGLLTSAGWGTFDGGTAGSGTMPTIRGSAAFEGYTSGATPIWTFWGSVSTSPMNGFALKRRGSPSRAFFYIEAITADRVYSYPDGSGAIVIDGVQQTLTNKILDTTIKLVTGAAGSWTVFQGTGGAGDRLTFDLSAMSALRSVSWPDLAGRAVVRNAEGNHTGQVAALGSQTLATAPPVGMYRVTVYMRTSATGTGAADFRLNWNDGTARTNVVLATLDLTATTYAQATFAIYVASGNVTYDVTFGAAATYDARVRMEAI